MKPYAYAVVQGENDRENVSLQFDHPEMCGQTYIQAIPLFTHPVKEQELLDEIEDLKLQVKYLKGCKPNIQVVAELEALKAHPAKDKPHPKCDEACMYLCRMRELTDEEIMEIVADKYEKGHGRYIDTKLFFVEFAKAILRKAQEK